MFSKLIGWDAKSAKMQIYCFLQYVRRHFCTRCASIFVTSKLQFSQSVEFYNTLLVASFEKHWFLKNFLWRTSRAASGAQMRTKSDAKTVGCGTTWEQRTGRLLWGTFYGAVNWGFGTWGKAKGNGTWREQRRHALWGESLWGDIIGQCVRVWGRDWFINPRVLGENEY